VMSGGISSDLIRSIERRPSAIASIENLLS
jgi:hypothetical protein